MKTKVLLINIALFLTALALYHAKIYKRYHDCMKEKIYLNNKIENEQKENNFLQAIIARGKNWSSFPLIEGHKETNNSLLIFPVDNFCNICIESILRYFIELQEKSQLTEYRIGLVLASKNIPFVKDYIHKKIAPDIIDKINVYVDNNFVITEECNNDRNIAVIAVADSKCIFAFLIENDSHNNPNYEDLAMNTKKLIELGLIKKSHQQEGP